MNKEQIVKLLRFKEFKKFTGPPEHWLTTLNTGFWGLEIKHEERWRRIRIGDLFVFHSTAIEYLKDKPKIPTGIIGVGVVSGRSKKKSLEWIGEIKTDNNRWPLLIHFSEIWWFGKSNEIENKPIKNKLKLGEIGIIKEINKITDQSITFKEMRNHNCAIPAQGSIQNISANRRDKLANLIVSHLWGNPQIIETISDSPLEEEKHEILPIFSEEDIIKNLIRRSSNLREINLEETDEQAVKRENKKITYDRNYEAQEKANKKHRKTLSVLSQYIKNKGIIPQESVIDLLAEKNNEIFIFEVKSVHHRNFKSQTRSAIGQLLEYEYFEVKGQKVNYNKKVYKGVVYSKEPSREIIDFLNSINIEVYWIRAEELLAENRSKELLDNFLIS